MRKYPCIKLRQLFILVLISTFLTGIFWQLNAQTGKVPGIIVSHIPASAKTYIGSPAICILSNGDYVASHDHFGPGTTEHQQALTAVYKSKDRGKSWKKISEINGQFWSNLFVHQGKLYIMGTWKHHGNFIIRCSPIKSFLSNRLAGLCILPASKS